MIALVTGAAGFIGSHLCRELLASGVRVVGIDNIDPYYSVQLKRDRLASIESAGGSRFRFIEVDIADEAALDEGLRSEHFDVIVHLAAQAGVRYSIENPGAYIRSNLVGHANMLELARRRNVAHFVYASSSSVYGGNRKLPFAVEDRVDHPLSLYAATKRADELLSESYSHLYRLPQTGLRFFTVYGPWGRPDMAVWRFTDAILDGRPVAIHGSGEIRRDFTYVDDIVSGIIAVMNTPPLDDGIEKAGGSIAPHRLYNIGNSRNESLDQLIAYIEQACGRKALREIRPAEPGDVDATIADVDAIYRDLNFRPATSLGEGIPRFVRWYRAYSSR